MNYEEICLSCFKNIIKDFNFKNLFKFNVDNILCKNCKDNIFYNINYEVIPLNYKCVHVFYIINKNKNYFNDILEINLLKNAFIKAIKENKEIIYFPIFNKKILNIFDKIFIKDFILVTTKER